MNGEPIRLRDMEAEQILKEIEKRSEKLRDADKEVGVADANFKAFEALSTLAFKEAHGGSMVEAEKRVRAGEKWHAQYMTLQNLRADAAHAKRNYQRAVIAQDLWRTERATMRAA